LKKNKTKIRVRYGETDQMGIVYYGNYALYLEQGRTEWLRELGFSYKYMEAHDIHLPVIHLSVDYKKPAHYDDIITVVTTLEELPAFRIKFYYEIFNEEQELLATAKTQLAFVNSKTGKLQKAPDYLIQKLIE
jgi:acyl-CoA thioester hydrolase